MNQDLISRQAILKHIEKKRQDALMIDDLRESNIIMMGMKLLEEAVRIQPSAQPEKMQLSKEDATKGTTFDCISRQAAIDSVCEVCEYCEYFKNEKLIQTIKDLPSAQPEHTGTHSCDYQRAETHGWIPVSEALPEDACQCIVTAKVKHVDNYPDYEVDTADFADGIFTTNNSWWGVESIIAWMPLPEPYAERKEDE